MDISFNQHLVEVCKKKDNYLCIGLDIDPNKFSIGSDTTLKGMEQFTLEIINATISFCPIYKPNFAFFERYGAKGYALLEKIVDSINGRAIVIADAKRGDIGNTSIKYAKSIFEVMGFDAVTISPYMGRDAIEPYLNYSNKGVFVLGLTSNPSAFEIQGHGTTINPLYAKVIEIINELNEMDNIGLVVGGTQAKIMKKIRTLSKNIPWLIPGIGAQGGSLEQAIQISHNNGFGIINVSRGILYAGDGSISEITKAALDYTFKIRELTCKKINC